MPQYSLPEATSRGIFHPPCAEILPTLDKYSLRSDCENNSHLRLHWDILHFIHRSLPSTCSQRPPDSTNLQVNQTQTPTSPVDLDYYNKTKSFFSDAVS